MWPFRTRPVVAASRPSDQPLANRPSSDLTIAELFQLLGQRLSQSSRPAASPSSPALPVRKLSARAIHVATRDRRLFLEQERARTQQQSRLQPPSE